MQPPCLRRSMGGPCNLPAFGGPWGWASATDGPVGGAQPGVTLHKFAMLLHDTRPVDVELAFQTPLNAPPSAFCSREILSGAGSSLATSASSIDLKCMGGPPMGSSGRAAGIRALRVSFHKSWVVRRAREELRGGGVAERSL
eukprot:2747716-Pyramimonas_sp.AAC.1